MNDTAAPAAPETVQDLTSKIAESNDKADVKKSAPIAEPAKVAKDAPAAPDSEDDSDEGENEHDEAPAASDGTDAPAKPKKNKGVGKRIDELTREKYEEKRARESAERELSQMRERVAKLEQPSEGEPQLGDYNFDLAAYNTARDSWVRRQTETELTTRQKEAQQREQQEKAQHDFQSKIDAFEAENPGAWAKSLAAPINYTEPMLEVIKSSAEGVQIAYYLAEHLDEADSISRMSPYQAAAAMVRLESHFHAATDMPPPRPVSVTKAPAPVKTLRPSAPISNEWKQMSTAEHVAEYRKRNSK